ncbi:NCS1 family nucleobase:cation symporter-1 [Nitratireductor basaltis]|uniref:Permease for cytosine/purine, uracil, thiamine, allantoin n=1 Tax=Nitratireductor basaltis TaxID=472175 RepID=A0A084UDT4_9HYPH|nr:NCS1 family nucleobase:cation symporter-1 [Nitratireductor basaltis]KFB11120.1 Permease for cytosine/purine, uracil, thiamine, allantoin [Nitratireductor basaltis]
MNNNDFNITGGDPSLYNEDLAPLPLSERKWGSFEIFNVWSNDIQSLFGYTLAATLFVTSGLNGWWVFAAIILAGLIVMGLVNLTGKPSVEYGIPYPVIARAAMGVRGANFPAMVRGIVAIFWYGVQTYFASTAVAMLIYALFGGKEGGTFLGLTGVDWIAYLFVSAFQVALFMRGMDWVTKFLNFAGPAVYAVMILMALYIWYAAGNELFSALGAIFEPAEGSTSGLLAFLGVVGTMIAYFAAVVINYGDFSRFVKSPAKMRMGNFLGLPVSLALFSFLTMWTTAGATVLFGETLTSPAEMVAKVDSVFLTLIAALTFFGATVGINLVANFIPPAYDLANLAPSKISARTGGLITAAIAFFIGALWVTAISNMGIPVFVDTLGAVLAPLYGILVADYYLVHKGKLDLADLYSTDPDARYAYSNGWNKRAFIAFGIAAFFSVLTVHVPMLQALSGFAWIMGAILGGGIHVFLSRQAAIETPGMAPAE